jgi:hypothetical protein
MAVQGGMYWYELICTLLATWMYQKPQNGTYQYVLPPVIAGQYVLVQTGCTALYLRGTRWCLVPAWYKVVQGAMKVVQGDIWW